MRFLILLLSIFIFVSCQTQQLSSAQRAKNYLVEKKYEQAIEAYQKHIETRLKNKHRPEWENPYVYYLDIGDIYLEQTDLTNALQFYLQAEEHKVDQSLVSDRIRRVATWYEEHDQLDLALVHLQKYQDRDPEFFNMMLDRIAKKYAKDNIK